MEITVDKKELLEKLEENRANHREIFEEALEGYRETVIDLLDQRLADVRAGKKIDMHFNIVEPQDHTREYDVAIAMVKMSVDDTIDLDQHQFQNYVMDDWNWKQNFLYCNANYSKLASDTIALTTT